MLVTLTALALTLLSAAAGWFSHYSEGAVHHAVNSPVTPRDPSTLALTAIGAGTIAIYLAAKWRPARKDSRPWTARSTERSKQRDPHQEDAQQPSRGAA